MPGRSTVDAIFILRRMQGSYLEKNKVFFVDLKRAFNWMPKKVIKWALKKKLVPVRLVQAVMSMYKGAKTRVQVGGGHSEEFDFDVDAHQGTVLPFFFQ